MTSTNTQTTSKTRLWAGRISAAFVTLGFLGSAITKFAHVPQVIAQLTHTGLPEGAILPIGILELSCLALYLYPRTSILGTFLLTGFIGGAIVVHIIGRESFAPPLMVGIMMFASSYLRHAELQRLVPFRNIDQTNQVHAGRPAVDASHAFDRGKAPATR
jgi:hypothetical protein